MFEPSIFFNRGSQKIYGQLKKKEKKRNLKKIGQPSTLGAFRSRNMKWRLIDFEKGFHCLTIFLCALPSFAASLESLRDG